MSTPGPGTRRNELQFDLTDGVLVHFSIGDFDGPATCAAAISAAIDRHPRPVTAAIAGAEPGIAELRVQMTADDSQVKALAVSNDDLHVALQLDTSQLHRYDELGWTGPCPDNRAYVAVHVGERALHDAVEQAIQTLTSAIGFDEADELQLTISH